MPTTTKLYSFENRYPTPLPVGMYTRYGTTMTIREDMTAEELAEFNLVLAPDKPTVNDEVERLDWDSENFQWVVTPFSAEELQRVEDAKWHRVREERDSLLKSTDLTAIVELEKTGTVPEALRTFRQTLRDLPSNYDNPDDVVFPDLPEGISLINNDGTQ